MAKIMKLDRKGKNMYQMNTPLRNWITHKHIEMSRAMAMGQRTLSVEKR